MILTLNKTKNNTLIINYTPEKGRQELLNEQVEQINELEKENRLLKITYGKCRDCRYADEYKPSYAYPYIQPRCSKGVKSIDYDSTACEDFELIGRLSR